jgi:glycosyltransferase involved in cell wall biosynthesis
MQKILINGLQLSDKNTGVQYYTKNLFEQLIKLKNNNYNFQLLKIPAAGNQLFKKYRLHRILFENLFLPNLLRKSKFDLYHSTNYILPLFFNFPAVLTVHDLITLDYPQFCNFKSVLYFRLFLPNSIKKATKIIVLSTKVKEDILKRFNIRPENIEVVYPGISPIFKKIVDKYILNEICIKYNLPNQYILFVGNIEPKKNLERLVKAFHLVRKSSELRHKLVIAGKKGWKYNSVFKTINNLKLGNEIIFTNYVPEEDLPGIYSMADLFVFPSLYEGFGFPPLEAMASEIPVIVSNKGALPEITGGLCLEVDPYNPLEMAKGIQKLLTDKNLREKYIRQGHDWVKQYTWEKAAGDTLRIYEQAINMSSD